MNIKKLWKDDLSYDLGLIMVCYENMKKDRKESTK